MPDVPFCSASQFRVLVRPRLRIRAELNLVRLRLRLRLRLYIRLFVYSILLHFLLPSSRVPYFPSPSPPSATSHLCVLVQVKFRLRDRIAGFRFLFRPVFVFSFDSLPPFFFVFVPPVRPRPLSRIHLFRSRSRFRFRFAFALGLHQALNLRRLCFFFHLCLSPFSFPFVSASAFLFLILFHLTRIFIFSSLFFSFFPHFISTSDLSLNVSLTISSTSQTDSIGISSWLLSSGPHNVPFYEKHGYKVVGEIRMGGEDSEWEGEELIAPIVRFLLLLFVLLEGVLIGLFWLFCRWLGSVRRGRVKARRLGRKM